MATNCSINVKTKNNEILSIYVHNDGYPEHMVRTLYEYYDSLKKAEAIVALGDLSSLNKRLEPIGDHTFSNFETGTTIAYGRDRGEKGTKARKLSNIDQIISEYKFNYYYEDSNWYFITQNGHRKLLSDILSNIG